jgi:hypothetical protein
MAVFLKRFIKSSTPSFTTKPTGQGTGLVYSIKLHGRKSNNGGEE